MRPVTLLSAALLCATAALACSDSPLDSPPPGPPSVPAPALASPNVAVGFTVGQPMSYDAAKAGAAFTGSGALQYQVTFEGTTNGLSASGATVLGQPLAPGVTWATITATDAQGRTASDRFAIVAFTPGLATPTLPATPFQYSDAELPFPAHFRVAPNGPSVLATDNTPQDNAITDAGATLGRVLFYDMRLSANDGLSCAGCHSPFIGFSDTPRLSVGFAGGLTGRHAPALANARFYRRGRFFWDERAATLEAQVLRPIQDGTEMGMTLDNVVAKIEATHYYAPLFTAAFGSPSVTSDRVSRALAQYVRSLRSTDSRFDRAFTPAGTPNFAAVFTAQELDGERLFRATGCAGCHTTVAQVSDSVHNTGLDAVSADTGAGRGAFKAPSLRNVAVRPRFMHDGRFTSLAQVIEFYDHGVQPDPNLDRRLRNPDGTPRRLNLTPAQKAALLAFLNTLTDSTFLTSPRFANPFAPAATPPAPPGTPTQPGAAVVIRATAYNPATITVARGTVVTWTNLDNARHSATFASAAIGSTPIFTSGSQSLAMPTTPGTYNYQCAIHGAAMSGTVIVQ
ncbi:MAG TPA: cytochrome c peroxidase [Longimicrobium sp.]|nr:cytochrome c peroxidase [Longimicrobium sp.]